MTTATCLYIFFGALLVLISNVVGIWVERTNWMYSHKSGTAHDCNGGFYYIVEESDYVELLRSKHKVKEYEKHLETDKE